MSFFNKEKIITSIPVKIKDATRLVIAFPNTYTVGMASLGYQNAWKLFNQSENIEVTRWFTDIQEQQNNTRRRGRASSPTDYVGFSFSWELDYKNIFSMLEKNNIPLHAKDRSEDDPIVFCGGQVPNANPEPFCENFDFFLIGDLEVLADQLARKIIEVESLKRDEKINELSKLEGVYVPHHRGTFKKPITKNDLSYSSILTPNSVWPNIFLLEVARSCPELCRFCLASYGSLPFRTPDVKKSLIPAIDLGLKHTNKIGLLGASVTQHPQFEELIDYLLIRNSEVTSPLQVQIASVRADTISKNIAEGLYKLGSKSLTMAVETGSERLRDIINKKVSNETIFNSIQTIYNAGFNSIKLYGMVGLPYETKDDLNKTVEFLKQIKLNNKTKKLVWGCSVFVPKAQTPFQWFGVDKNAPHKLKSLSKELHQIGIDFRPESYRWTTIQALISRGDKSINKILEDAYRYGNTLGSFNKAIKENKAEIDSNHFIFQNWDTKIKLPWENVQGYLNKETVKEHAKKVSIVNV
ncbi:MAG: radical SAM protein [Candidatus Melainabacteria bacterium]|nr:radical SAM protein [Candidatus Melainabacteria bacterium]